MFGAGTFFQNDSSVLDCLIWIKKESTGSTDIWTHCLGNERCQPIWGNEVDIIVENEEQISGGSQCTCIDEGGPVEWSWSMENSRILTSGLCLQELRCLGIRGAVVDDDNFKIGMMASAQGSNADFQKIDFIFGWDNCG